MEELPVKTLAALSCGLPASSRTMRKAAGIKLTVEEMLLATIADRLGVLVWMKTKDAQRGKNRPKSILSELMTEKEKPMAFKTSAEFLAAREAILGGDKQ